jgi:hypothetical protein
MGPSDGRPRSEDDIGRRTNKASAQGAREVPFSLKWKNQSRGREEERSPSDRGSEGGERRNIREGGERNREEWAVNAKPRTSFSLSILLPRRLRRLLASLSAAFRISIRRGEVVFLLAYEEGDCGTELPSNVVCQVGAWLMVVD